MSWYSTVRHGTFDFAEEAVRYCKNDTMILMRACMIFRENFITETSLDPFKRSTIASACMYVFRTLFLQEKTLAIPCPYDYKYCFK